MGAAQHKLRYRDVAVAFSPGLPMCLRNFVTATIPFLALYCGDCCADSQFGRVITWGGNPAAGPAFNPIDTSSTGFSAAVGRTLTNVAAVAAGYDHCLALRSDGRVMGWGFDGYTQVQSLLGLSNVVAVAAGFHVSLALLP